MADVHIKKKKILVVEDDPLVSYREAMLLENNGYSVIRSSTGEKALRAFKDDPEIELILMDLDLGDGMDGAETARRILQEREVPISFLTAHKEKEYVDRIKSVPNYGYILKNAGEYVLMNAIERGFTQFREKLKMADSCMQLHSIFKHLPVSTFCLDENTNVRKMNECAADFCGKERLDPAGVYRIGTAVNCINHDEVPEGCGFSESCSICELREILTETLQKGNKIHQKLLHLTRKNGGASSRSAFIAHASLLPCGNNESSVLLTLVDELAVQEKEAAIAELKRKNRSLITEINHRVSNNLSTVEALARVELSSEEKSKEDAIGDIISRIQAIHIIHDKLYRADDISSLDISRYIQDLAETISKTFYKNQQHFRLHIDIEPISFSTKLNTPLGVITAELLTNTFKYAVFSGVCDIYLDIRREGNIVVYTYRDTGTGLEGRVESIDDLRDGTGILLIRELAAGLEGELTLNTEQGTEFRISFPFPE